MLTYFSFFRLGRSIFFFLLILFFLNHLYSLVLLVEATPIEMTMSTPEKKIENHQEPIILRVATYNIQHGTQGLEKVRDVLKEVKADMIALNEVDNSRARSKFVSQGSWLASELGMHAYFGPAKDSTYGNLLLSRYPILEADNKRLVSFWETRGCLTGLVKVSNNTCLRIFVTHLGLWQSERIKQLREIKLFMKSYPEENKILLGDFNTRPSTPEIGLITECLRDAFGEEAQGEETTYPCIPGARIDYIFVSSDLEVREAKVLGETASDHHPVIADLSINN